MTLMTVISEDLLSRGQAGKNKPKVPACPRARQKVAKLVSPCHRELCRRCSASLSGYGHELPCLRLRWLSEVEICYGASKVGNKVLYLCYTVKDTKNKIKESSHIRELVNGNY